MVLTDAPLAAGGAVRAYNHHLGECGITFFGDPRLAKELGRGFPASLQGCPMLLPAAGSAFRSGLAQWFDNVGARPRILAECEDSSLLKAFGEQGVGILPAPSVIEQAVIRQQEVRIVGRVEEIREHFFAISLERKLKNPAVVAICDAARQLFA